MKGWTTLGTGHTVELAGPGARLGARILDEAMIFVVFIAALLALDQTLDSDVGSDVVFLVLAAVSLIFVLSYEVVMTALKGQTIGKMATNVKVVRADNGELVGWGKSIGRRIIPVLLAFIPFIGWILALLVYISLTWDRTRQGWHDKAAGTLVIKT